MKGDLGMSAATLRDKLRKFPTSWARTT
jgi:hypothetical protein